MSKNRKWDLPIKRSCVSIGICGEAEAVRDPCPGIYCGETGRTEGERIPEHTRLYNNNDAESVFYQHMIDCHNGEKKDRSGLYKRAKT